MKALPQGWAEATVGDLGDYINGLAFKPTDWGSDGWPIIRIQNLTDSSKPFNFTDRSVSDEYIVRAGDLLVSWSATLDAFIWDRAEAVLNQHIFKVVPNTLVVDRKFLYFRLKETIRELISSEHLHGSTMKHINRGPFLAKSLPLPPLDEQTRIALKLDALFEKSRSIREKLDRLPRLLANLQKSILNSAFRGTDNWKAASVGSVLLDIRYGTSKKCQSEPRGTAVLRIPNIGERGIQIDDLKYAEFTPTESARLALDVGDLLLIRSNGSVDLVGKTAVVSKRETGMLYAGYLIRMRVNRSLILPEFLHYWLMTPSVREIIERTAKSTSGVNNINSEEVRSLPLLLPPLEVQTQICARVAQAFSSIDRLSATFDTAAGKVGMMDMSILSKAFRGELVPQDPNDEPASVLLERIRAQKPVAGTKRGRGRKAAA